MLLSYGLDRRWKRRVVRMAGLGRDERLLDLATGTGDLAFLGAEQCGSVVGLDVTWRMLELASGKRRGAAPRFVAGDMLDLPFAAGSFDVVTTGYGIRNVPDLGRALDEVARVLRPGGRFFSLDFDRPGNRILWAVYFGYLTVVGSALGLVLHRDADAYRYIPESLRGYPGSRQVAHLLERRGFEDVGVVPVLGGLMAIHHARKRKGV